MSTPSVWHPVSATVAEIAADAISARHNGPIRLKQRLPATTFPD